MKLTYTSLEAGTRWWHRFSMRDIGLVLVGVLSAASHWQWPEIVHADAALSMMIGTLVGLMLCSRNRPLTIGRAGVATEVVVHDIQTLHQAFGVLQQQVNATIRTSETAVMSMMDRMNRVHGNALDLRERIVHAVDRSQSLSSDSLSRAGQHGQAVAALAEHQARFEEAQAQNQMRVRAVAEQVRQLTPLAALIDEIARQTNLLAINASIEAARAGREGAGFKVVAAEVRRLSTQTSEAARQISAGIGQAAAAIDTEMAGHQASQGESAASVLSRSAGALDLAVHAGPGKVITSPPM